MNSPVYMASILSAVSGMSSTVAFSLIHNGIENYFGVSLRLFASAMAWLSCIGFCSLTQLKGQTHKGMIILFSVIGLLFGAYGGLSAM